MSQVQPHKEEAVVIKHCGTLSLLLQLWLKHGLFLKQVSAGDGFIYCRVVARAEVYKVALNHRHAKTQLSYCLRRGKG